MDFKGIQICCPFCKGELTELQKNGNKIICESCQKTFPIVLDIPDLRVFPDPYIDREKDIQKGQRIAERFDDFDFAGLIDYYYSITPVVPPKHAEKYKIGLLAGEARARNALREWENDTNAFTESENDMLLDVGCGTAPMLVSAGQKFRKVVGVDIAFRWLVMAKKRLVEAGLDIPLLCACAEALPFPDNRFQIAVAESVIENVQDQEKMTSECYRVLKQRGHLFLSTPNRFSIGPDPHTGILAGGYLPDKLVARLVKKQGGIPPKRNLLSVRQLKKLVESKGFVFAEIKLPDIPQDQLKYFGSSTRVLARLYHFLKRLPLVKSFLMLISPLLYLTAQKRSF